MIEDRLRLAVAAYIENTRLACGVLTQKDIPPQHHHVIGVVQAVAEAVLKSKDSDAVKEYAFRSFLYELQRVALQTIHDMDEMTLTDCNCVAAMEALQ